MMARSLVLEPTRYDSEADDTRVGHGGAASGDALMRWIG
jgi:hypothetical protein